MTTLRFAARSRALAAGDHVAAGAVPAHRAPLEIRDVTHRYGDVVALRDLSLQIAPGEFVTLLGPSGCGKTTLLRIVAGFLSPSTGRVVVDGRDITALPPHRRSVNMVFQRPTLLPHLDVFGNVAFGPRIAKASRGEIRTRVAEALALVRLDGFERRRAHELSGGQIQRVALARALINRPEVLLLDEPLSALDLKVRLEMEVELRRLHRETGATFIYVTHDQREALALSDRIAVFNHGRIDQIGTPKDIYMRPATGYVASFVGDANVLPAELVSGAAGRALRIGGAAVPSPESGRADGPVAVVVRPEAVELGGARTDAAQLEGIVADVAFRGSGVSYRIAVDGLTEPLKAEIASLREAHHDVGDRVWIGWERGQAILVDRDAP